MERDKYDDKETEVESVPTTDITAEPDEDGIIEVIATPVFPAPPAVPISRLDALRSVDRARKMALANQRNSLSSPSLRINGGLYSRKTDYGYGDYPGEAASHSYGPSGAYEMYEEESPDSFGGYEARGAVFSDNDKRGYPQKIRYRESSYANASPNYDTLSYGDNISSPDDSYGGRADGTPSATDGSPPMRERTGRRLYVVQRTMREDTEDSL